MGLPADSEIPGIEARRRCTNFRPDLTHPWLIAESTRLERLSGEGPSFIAYQGLSERELEGLAAQQDSGAMIVLAERAVASARGEPLDNVVARLAGQEPSMNNGARRDVDEEAQKSQLANAEKWFYLAALHGRVAALTQLGDVQRRLGLGPVELGWIEAQDYEALEQDTRLRLWPTLVYQEAAFRLGGGIMESPLFVLLMESHQPQPAADDDAVRAVTTRFERDLRERGLRMPDIPEYQGPDLDAWRAEFCDG